VEEDVALPAALDAELPPVALDAGLSSVEGDVGAVDKFAEGVVEFVKGMVEVAGGAVESVEEIPVCSLGASVAALEALFLRNCAHASSARSPGSEGSGAALFNPAEAPESFELLVAAESLVLVALALEPLALELSDRRRR